ncbi:MAG: hypothetical protein CL920_12450 [Deltaproteobacteria bacterium]|nr:hypothetical protein [Deltaproteobacteria bacterium]
MSNVNRMSHKPSLPQSTLSQTSDTTPLPDVSLETLGVLPEICESFSGHTFTKEGHQQPHPLCQPQSSGRAYKTTLGGTPITPQERQAAALLERTYAVFGSIADMLPKAIHAKLTEAAKTGQLQHIADPKLPLTREQKQALIIWGCKSPQHMKSLNTLLKKHDLHTAGGRKAFETEGKKALATKIELIEKKTTSKLLQKLKGYALDTPDKLLKDPHISAWLEKLGLKNIKAFTSKLGMTKDVVEGMIALNEVAKQFKAGGKRSALKLTGHTLLALGSFSSALSATSKNPLKALTQQSTQKALNTLLSLTRSKLSKSTQLSIKALLHATTKAAPGALAKIAGHMLNSDFSKAIAEAGNTALSIMRSDALTTAEKTQAGLGLGKLLTTALPDAVAKKFLAKVAGKKIPLLSIALAIPDLLSTLKSGYKCVTGDKKQCAETGLNALKTVGAAAGSIPTVGTLISAGVDFVVLGDIYTKYGDKLIQSIQNPLDILSRLKSVTGS